MKDKTVASPVTINDVSKKVKEFYLREDISYRMTGISECDKMGFFCKSLGGLKISLVAFSLSKDKAFKYLDDM